ncbi:MAG: transposase, partial [Nitrospira sp.]|nr:transposase [Nitrospira sp.]
MAGIDVSVSKELLPGLLGSPDGLAKLVEAVLNQILEAQVTEALGAERHERSEERTLYTRVGPVRLLVPQPRDGSFSTALFQRDQRSESKP